MSTAIQELEKREQELRERYDSLRLIVRNSESDVANVEQWLEKSGLGLTVEDLKNSEAILSDMNNKLEKLATTANEKLDLAKALVEELEGMVSDQ